ncbi:Protein NLRC5, partial [Nibea albiflora]
MKLCRMMPSDAKRNIIQPASSSAELTKHIKTMLEYFTLAKAADCRKFLEAVCMLCEDIPMHLESRLMSVAGCANDHWEQYIAAVGPLLLKRWERLSEHLVGKVLLENVWVSPRTVNRGRDRPDQTPGPGDRGSRTPEPDGDYGSMESRVTLETFLQGCAGKVTVLLGQSGSGKTLLMSRLGQQWACRLGPIPSSVLFVLLEFRQLNFVSLPLSLSDLLFRHYLPQKGGDDEKRTIVDYLISNPEQICWVLDGYDEFHSKLKPRQQLLPGCTVVVTCRARDVIDLEGVSDKVGQLLGWDGNEIKEYVHNFFEAKGHGIGRALGRQAANLLLSTQHLLAMSSLPALCNICCICLEHLLLEERGAERMQILGERGSMMREKNRERGVQMPGRGGGGGGGDKVMDVTNGEAQLPVTPAQILSTQTQVYLTVLGAFLSCDPEKRGRNDTPKTMTPQQSIVYTLSQYQPELWELSQLAWKGLEGGKIVFLEEDISQDVLKFSIRTGLFSQVELRREDGTLVNSYSFIHLTVQEFLAALRIMTSQEVSDTQLRKRFSLKTRWMTKSDQRTVFTDSLHLYVCGLASPHCTEALVQLARTSGGTGGSNWVQKRQALVVKLLKNLCNSNTLTGPKVLELCHCVQESQNQQLAQQVVGTRRTLELRNIRLLTSDIDALAFVVNSVGDNGIGLDFGACSMELECLDVLPRCQYIHYLCFRSRKYGDKFAEKLSSILPNFTTLRKFGGMKELTVTFSKNSDFNSLTGGQWDVEILRTLTQFLPKFKVTQKITLQSPAQVSIVLSESREKPAESAERSKTLCASNNGIAMEGVLILAGALCSHNNLTQIHISSLTDEAIENLLKILPKMKSLQRLDLSNNSLTQQGLLNAAGALRTCGNVSGVEGCMGAERCLIWFTQHEDCDKTLRLRNNSLDPDWIEDFVRLLNSSEGGVSVSLSHCVWSPAGGLQLIKALGECVRLEGLWLNEVSAANGLLDLLAAMEGLTHMEEIGLEGWRMADGGVEQLIRVLPFWTELRKISLSENLISDQSGDKLLQAMISCSQLEEL